MHVGAQTTHDTVALAARAAETGADAVAVIAPPYFALDEEELLAHFAAAAAACAPVPFYLYEFEARSGYAIPVAVVERLREQAPNLAGLKVSDSPWDKVAPYLLEGLDVFVGAEGLLVEGLAAGAAGAVSGLAASFPDAVVPLVRAPSPELGEKAAALRASLSRLPFHAASKTALGLRGVPVTAEVCAPLRGLTEAEQAELERIVRDCRSVRPARVSALRSLILAAADSPRLQRFVQRYGFRLGAARFVAGESLDDAVPVLRRLNEQGLLTNTTLLGEGVHDEAQTREVVAAYRELLDRIQTEGLRTNVALKLTHLGLSIDEELAQRNVAELVEHAAARGNFVRIDMEESRHVDATLRIYRRLRESGHENVGTVLQSYLFRTESDLAALLPLAPEPAPRQGRLPRAAGDRLPAQARRRRRVRPAAGDVAPRRRLHRGRNPRRDADRARDLVRPGARHPEGALPVPDAVRRPAPPAARPRSARLRRPRGHAVRARVVPLPHAPARRAAGQRSLPASESRARLSSRRSTPASATRARSRASRYHDQGAA